MEKRKAGRPKGSGWATNPEVSQLDIERQVPNGTWFRIAEGKDENNLGFGHRIEVIDVQDGLVTGTSVSENRGMISLEPILIKVMRRHYKKGELGDSRFRKV